MAKTTTPTRKLIEDDAALQPSYGVHVPDPSGFPRGTVCTFGYLAGSGDVTPLRSVSMDDSDRAQATGKPYKAESAK